MLLLMGAITCNGQTKEQVRDYIYRIGVPHPEIVYAQARLETGNFKSRLYKQHNNLFGIKHKGKYARYGHWKESVRDYKRSISKRYQKGCYYAFLRKIGYASDPQYTAKVRAITNQRD